MYEIGGKGIPTNFVYLSFWLFSFGMHREQTPGWIGLAVVLALY